ncbi:hypothetical protein LWI28_016567 [Acer negundo]|uniref:C-JID domain-containing protein n=1 Tax=Acer negundo TaxID=4023 RepID=A0AAD5JFW4_ACENE|nr:hypothetical protein LWI28_016567 [Acer negundo]
MARGIVHQESPKEPGNRSRLWIYNDICCVLTNKTGTEAVEVIYQNSSGSKEIYVDADAFSRMNNLRLLKIHDVHPSKGLDVLPNKLRILKWHGYPLKSLPPSFKAEKLLKLNLSHSHIEQLWKGTAHLDKLKIIKLSHSRNLIRTPDFVGVPNLEKLILEGLWSLTRLDLSDCNLSDGAIPVDLGLLSALRWLNLSKNDFVSLPESINRLSNLQDLRVEYCQNLQALPELPSNIQSLSTDNCSSLATLPSLLGLGTASYLEFSHYNCFRLIESQGDNNVVLSLVKDHLCLLGKIRFLLIFSMYCQLTENQSNIDAANSFIRTLMNILFKDLPNPASYSPRLVVNLSGTGIPDWFTHQTTSSSFTIELHQNWCQDYGFLGLAFCASFEFQGNQGQKQRKEVQNLPVPAIIRIKYDFKYDFKFKFYLISDEGNYIIYSKEFTFSKATLAVSNHLWLLLLPFDQYLQKKNWRYVKAYFELEGSGFEFIKCGIRPMYMQDVTLGESMFQGLDPSQLVPLITQIMAILRSAVQDLKTPKSHERHHCNDEAGTSGSGSCDDNAEMRESIDPLVELKGKRVQE